MSRARTCRRGRWSSCRLASRSAGERSSAWCRSCCPVRASAASHTRTRAHARACPQTRRARERGPWGKDSEDLLPARALPSACFLPRVVSCRVCACVCMNMRAPSQTRTHQQHARTHTRRCLHVNDSTSDAVCAFCFTTLGPGRALPSGSGRGVDGDTGGKEIGMACCGGCGLVWCSEACQRCHTAGYSEHDAPLLRAAPHSRELCAALQVCRGDRDARLVVEMLARRSAVRADAVATSAAAAAQARFIALAAALLCSHAAAAATAAAAAATTAAEQVPAPPGDRPGGARERKNLSPPPQSGTRGTETEQTRASEGLAQRVLELQACLECDPVEEMQQLVSHHASWPVSDPRRQRLSARCGRGRSP